MAESSVTPVAESHEPGTSGPTPPGNAIWDKLDALLEDLPPGIPILPPEDAGNFEKYTHRPRHIYAPGDVWKNCARILEKYDAELCKGYREEIDTLLVFAGLFSAVVTAFTIESYQWLLADPNDAIVELLSQIAQSTASNNTAKVLIPAAAGLPGPVSVRINIYWFLALALSLSAALVGILCKQWIREFERNAPLSPKTFVGVHQTKLEGLEKWKVGAIISLLPLLLQLALALFALGVLELLWQLHSAIAAVVCVPTIVAFVFYAATTVLPSVTYYAAVSYDCPYKSPQAMLAFPAYNICTWIRSTVTAGVSYLVSLIKHCLYALLCTQRDVPFPFFDGRADPRLGFQIIGWHVLSRKINLRLDRWYPQPLSVYRSLRWMHLNLDDGDITEWIWHCLWETALAPDPYVFGGEYALKRGFLHVQGFGTADVPQSGLRALALGYLVRTQSPLPFLIEAFIQNLGNMDAASAEYLIVVMMDRMESNYLDAEAVVSIFQTVGAYGRSHIQEPIGGFLLNVARFWSSIPPSDPQLRRVFLAYTTVLYHAWIGMQPVPHQPSTGRTNEAIVRHACFRILHDPEQYRAHPERLHLRPGVQELADLVSIYAQSHEDPEAALRAMAPNYAENLRPIFEALLEIARIGQDNATAAGDGGLVLGAALSPPLPLADPPRGPTPSHVQSEARVTEGDPYRSPSPRSYSARSTLSHAQSPDTKLGRAVDEVLGMEGERHSVSGSSGLRDGPNLQADAVHAPSDGRVQRRHSDNNADALRWANGEEDCEASGSAGGADAALSVGAGAEGAPDNSRSHSSASLRAVTIHSPSDAGAQKPAVHHAPETIHPLDPGGDRELRRDDCGADASVLQM